MFLIALLGEIFGFIGLFVPFVYVTERAISLGVPATKAAFLLSVIGEYQVWIQVHAQTLGVGGGGKSSYSGPR